MYQFVASINNYVMYHDDIRGNYKIHDGDKVIANPSTKEDAYFQLRSLNNNLDADDLRHCPNCDTIDCKDCERYS